MTIPIDIFILPQAEQDNAILKFNIQSIYNKNNNETWYADKARFINRHLYQASKKNAKNSSNKKGILVPHLLSLQEITAMWEHQKGLCAISGKELSFNKDCIRKASLDQILPSKGYTLENTWIVCSGINMMKNDWTVHDILEIYPEDKTTDLFRDIVNKLKNGERLSHNDELKFYL